MAFFDRFDLKEKLRAGIMGVQAVDRIGWDPGAESSVMVHRIADEDFPNGSSLVLASSQMAIVTNGADVVVFSEPGLVQMEEGDAQFAPFRTGSGKRQSALHGTVYYVNTSGLTELKWGTPTPLKLWLPVEQVEVGVRTYGFFSVRFEKEDIDRSRLQAGAFLRNVVGNRQDLAREELVGLLQEEIRGQVSRLLGEEICCKNLSLMRISMCLPDLAEKIRLSLQEAFNGLGLTLEKFTISAFKVEEEGMRKIQEAEKQRVLAQIQQKTEKTCPGCGNSLPAGVKFCPECGIRVG